MFRKRLVLSFLVYCFAVLPFFAHASSRDANLQAAVRAGSKPVPNAFVMVRGIRDEGVWETHADANGTFALRIGAGCYHLFVSAGGFFPYAERFCVKSDKDTVTLKLKLKPDSLRYGVID